MSHQNPYTISPIAAAVSAALATPAAALAQVEGATDTIDEVIVTARKREESLQDIPASIQAIPEAMLRDMGAMSTEDYARFIPSMVWRKTSGGGGNQIIFRGINNGPDSFIATASAGMYLDETSLTSIGDQPDIRMMDVARIEALPGPQGTLFGATGQGGTLRVITNQPDPSKFEASIDVSAFTGSTSDTSHSVTAVVNIPLVEDVFAIRIAAQTSEDAGFIDNVFGHTPDMWAGLTSDPSQGGRYPWYNDGGDINNRNAYAPYQGPACDPTLMDRGDPNTLNNCIAPGRTTFSWPYEMGSDRAEWGTLDNADVAEKNWNNVEHLAVKIAARWDINEDWSATLTYNRGENDATAFNDYNPFVGDLKTIAMTENRTDEEWDLTSLTIEADLGFAQFVSATSFYSRNFDYSYDGTFYYKYWAMWSCEDWGPLRGDAADSNPNSPATWDDPVRGRNIYYPAYCVMGAARGSDPTQQADYIGLIEGPSWQEKTAQEFRLSHQGEKFDWLVGLYYEDSEDNWDSVWLKSKDTPFQDSTSFVFNSARFSDPTFCARLYADPAAVGCVPGATFPDAEYLFLTTDRTNWEQKAVFGEVTWHLSDAWHVTLGGRFFETTNEKEYLKYYMNSTKPNGRQQGGIIRWDFAPDSDQIFQSDGSLPVKASIDEFVPKFGVQWNVTGDIMLYASYTEGFRPGGVNRANARADWSRTFFPQVWEPDKLKSTEIGFKSTLADGRMVLNLTYFNMNWENFQVELVDPSYQQCVDPALPAPCLGGAGSPDEGLPWLKVVGNSGDATSQGLEVQFMWIPAEGWELGANAQWVEAETDEDLILDPRADPPDILPKGSPLPNQPDFKGSAWFSYSWPVQFVRGGELVLRGDYSFHGESQNILISAPPEQLFGGRPERNPSFTNHEYEISNIRVSLISNENDWQVDLFVNNVGDERAEIYHGTGNFEYIFGNSNEYEHLARVYTNRPREYGLRFSQRWGD